MKSICHMITLPTCLFEKSSLCFQKPPAVGQLCLKSMLSISETNLQKSQALGSPTAAENHSSIFSLVGNVHMCKYGNFTSRTGGNQVAGQMSNSLIRTRDPMTMSCTVQRAFIAYLEWLLKAMGNVMDKELGTSKQAASFVHAMAAIQKLSKHVRDKICKTQIVKLEKEFPRALMYSTK